jgi:hypothetical protein
MVRQRIAAIVLVLSAGAAVLGAGSAARAQTDYPLSSTSPPTTVPSTTTTIATTTTLASTTTLVAKSTVAISLGGFKSDETVTVLVGTTSTSVFADSTGNVSVTVDATDGDTVSLSSPSLSVRGKIVGRVFVKGEQVEAPASADAATPAFTGAQTRLMVTVAIGLLGVGLFVARAARRRVRPTDR